MAGSVGLTPGRTLALALQAQGGAWEVALEML